MDSLVSICIPTYKNPRMLLNAISSALNQSYDNIEVIVFDDNSNDETEDIVSKIKDPRVFFYKSCANLRPPRSWNECIKRAKGSYLIVLPHDDILLPKFIETSMSIMKSNNDIGFVQSAFAISDSSLDLKGQKKVYKEKLFGLNALKWQVEYKLCIPASILINFDLVNEFFRDDFWDDWSYYARIGYKHGFIYHPEILSINRSHKEQLNLQLLNEEKPGWKFILDQLNSLYFILNSDDFNRGRKYLNNEIKRLSVSMFFTSIKTILSGKYGNFKREFKSSRKLNRALPFDMTIMKAIFYKVIQKRLANKLELAESRKLSKEVRKAINLNYSSRH